AARDDYLIDTLVDMGLVTDEQLGPIRQEADSNGEGLVDTLIARKIISARQVAQAKASQFGVEFVNLGEMRLTDDVISAVPRHIAKKYSVVPLYRHDDTVTVALSDPSDLDTLDSLRHLLNMEVEPRVASPDDIEEALGKYYGGGREDSVRKMIQEITGRGIQISNLADLSAA